MTTEHETGRHATRRERASEKRITATVGKPLRARLRAMAAEAGVTDSQLVFALVREALNARDNKPAKTSAPPAREGEPRTWGLMSIADVERALTEVAPFLVNASTPRSRRRRRRRRTCCTCHH